MKKQRNSSINKSNSFNDNATIFTPNESSSSRRLRGSTDRSVLDQLAISVEKTTESFNSIYACILIALASLAGWLAYRRVMRVKFLKAADESSLIRV